MGNLSALTQYFNKYMETNKEIAEFAENIDLKVKKNLIMNHKFEKEILTDFIKYLVDRKNNKSKNDKTQSDNLTESVLETDSDISLPTVVNKNVFIVNPNLATQKKDGFDTPNFKKSNETNDTPNFEPVNKK